MGEDRDGRNVRGTKLSCYVSRGGVVLKGAA